MVLLLLFFVAVPVLLLWLLIRPQYRRLAAQTAAAHEANERRWAEITAELSSMRVQLASLERVLTQVE
jgi:CRISPR/Cas system CSM-associated protein Csm2 small subunit